MFQTINSVGTVSEKDTFKKEESPEPDNARSSKKTVSRSLSVDLDKVDPETFDVADILKK